MRGDDDRHVAAGQNFQPFEKLGLAAQIEMRRRLVQKKNLRLADHGPCKPDRLLLSPRQAATTFRDRHVIAERVGRGELLDPGQACRFENLFVGR